MGMQLIETIEVGSGGASSIEFTSIPQDGVDLVLVVSARTDSDNIMGLQFNSDTGTNYNRVNLVGTGSGVSSNSYSSIAYISPGYFDTSTQTANTFDSTSIHIANYTSSSAKSVSSDNVTENNATAARQALVAGQWTGTSAITSIKIYEVNASTIVQHSTASLYIIS